MSQWYEVEQEVHGVSDGTRTVVTRHRVTRFGATPRLIAPGDLTHRDLRDGRERERRALPGPGALPTIAVAPRGPERQDATRAEVATNPEMVVPLGLVYERSFSHPGCYVRVPFGRFDAALAAQLCAPQAVAPRQLLDCLVQVYRVHRPLPLARLARVEGLRPELADGLRVLTRDAARALGLAVPPAQLPPVADAPPPSVAQPGQYLWSIQLLFDPTEDARTGLSTMSAEVPEST